MKYCATCRISCSYSQHLDGRKISAAVLVLVVLSRRWLEAEEFVFITKRTDDVGREMLVRTVTSEKTAALVLLLLLLFQPRIGNCRRRRHRHCHLRRHRHRHCGPIRRTNKSSPVVQQPHSPTQPSTTKTTMITKASTTIATRTPRRRHEDLRIVLPMTKISSRQRNSSSAREVTTFRKNNKILPRMVAAKTTTTTTRMITMMESHHHRTPSRC